MLVNRLYFAHDTKFVCITLWVTEISRYLQIVMDIKFHTIPLSVLLSAPPPQ